MSIDFNYRETHDLICGKTYEDLEEWLKTLRGKTVMWRGAEIIDGVRMELPETKEKVGLMKPRFPKDTLEDIMYVESRYIDNDDIECIRFCCKLNYERIDKKILLEKDYLFFPSEDGGIPSLIIDTKLKTLN